MKYRLIESYDKGRTWKEIEVTQGPEDLPKLLEQFEIEREHLQSGCRLRVVTEIVLIESSVS